MVKLTVAVMAVPQRLHHAMVIAEQLLAEGCDTEIYVDGERRGPWWNARRAWEDGLRQGGTHHLVLQDDAVLCGQFYPAAVKACAAISIQPISFYADRDREVAAAREAGKPWVSVKGGWTWGVALCQPTCFIEPFLKWADEHTDPEAYQDDTRLALFWDAILTPWFYTVPSLVDHAQVPSTLGARLTVAGKARRASWALTPEEDASHLTWPRDPEHIHYGRTAYFTREQRERLRRKDPDRV